MTRDEEILIREAAMLFLWRNLADVENVKHAERHLGQTMNPKDAATIASLRAMGCKPEDIVQQVTGHPPCIAAEPRPVWPEQ